MIKPDRIIRAHVKTHLLEFVEREAFMHDGKVCVFETGGSRITPVGSRCFGRIAFYVHPETTGLRFPLKSTLWISPAAISAVAGIVLRVGWFKRD